MNILEFEIRRPVARHLAASLLLAIATLSLSSVSKAGSVDPALAGDVHFALHMYTPFDVYTNAPSPSMVKWLNTHFERLMGYSTYFDKRLSWYSSAWYYVNSRGFAISDPIVAQHPDWILKDANGNFLYIGWGCSNGTCTKYAADPSNYGFQQYFISQAAKTLAKGYKGIWLDCVDMSMNITDGWGNQVAPTDVNTGQPMTLANWEKYFADYLTAIRQAFPAPIELIHNSPWTAGIGGISDPMIQKQILAADIINLEGGIDTPGRTGGNGPFSMTAFLNFIDGVHNLNRRVMLEEEDNFTGDYGLAGYFLISNGSDLEDDDTQTPDNWYAGYDVHLGAPLGDRYMWKGLFRRDFTNGVVLLNNPTLTSTISAMPEGIFTDVYGNPVTSLSLAPAQGKVLVGTPTFSNVDPFGIEVGGTQPNGYFEVDHSVTGGHIDTISSKTVNSTGVPNAAPASIYQTKRSSSNGLPFSYDIANLKPGSTYIVRMHFADDVSTTVGQRLFNVVLNGQQVLTNFDVYLTAGKVTFKAVVKEFTATVSSTGEIDIDFNPVNGKNALLSGLEFLPQ